MTFALFNLLPPELRYDIYWLATSRRVVMVCSEMEGWDEFWERWATDPMAGLYVHPDISYYAAHWDQECRLAKRNRPVQTTLTAYGFSAQRPRQGHWLHEDQFPYGSILDDKDVVFAMFKRCRFYSRTPIPPLLHMCSESRVALMARGYELALGTRTSDTQIWFNFRTDILQILDEIDLNFIDVSRGDRQGGRLVGQFRPRDLLRIRQIACSKTYGPQYLQLCRLMPNLKHVYVPADEHLWGDLAESSWMAQHGLAAIQPRPPRTDPVRFEYLLPFEEVDLLWSTLPYYYHQFRVETDVPLDSILMLWKQSYGFDGSFFCSLEQHIRDSLQQCLVSEQQLLQTRDSRHTGDDDQYRSSTMLEAPQFHMVHLLASVREAEVICYYRQSLWRNFSESWEDRLFLEQQSEDESSSPRGHINALQQGHDRNEQLSMSVWSNIFAEAARLPLDHRDHATKFDWWVKNGAPHTRVSAGLAALIP